MRFKTSSLIFLFASLWGVSFALLAVGTARAVSIQVLSPGGSLFGTAYDIDGNNVVGTTGSVGFLYDGSAYTKIFYPGSAQSAAYGISGDNIVGNYFKTGATRFEGFLYDGSTYVTLTYPLSGVRGTVPTGIDGNNIVGSYGDAAGKVHSFLYDGAAWTTLDFPSAKGTYARGISGSNIVGYYVDAAGIQRGFLYDGTTWTTLDDPMAGPPNAFAFTSANGISGGNIVGEGFSSNLGWGFLYDGSAYTYPLSTGFSGFIDGKFAGGNPWFGYKYYGISGNKIVGAYHDNYYGLDRPFILTIPEPSAFVLASLAAAGVLIFARRARLTRWRRACWDIRSSTARQRRHSR